MDFNTKNGTSLYKLYELVVLEKIRDAKPAKAKSARTGLELHCDGFGQMIYAHIPQNMKHW